MNFTADPEIGRFISQDTYRGEMGDPGQWHLYAYCANNPINYVDPSGHARYKNIKFSDRYSFTFKSYYGNARYFKLIIQINWEQKGGRIVSNSIRMAFYKANLQKARNKFWELGYVNQTYKVSGKRKSATHKTIVEMKHRVWSNVYGKVTGTIYSNGTCKWDGARDLFAK